MKTVSIHVSTLCVSCENRCRYCLLSWDGKLLGANYDRCQRYAERFYHWLRAHRPELSFQFYYGYSMEHPRLLEAIRFARGIGSAGGEFLQFDGLKFRTPAQITELLRDIQAQGIRLIDLTFYGTRRYHDRFAGRAGDFDYMLEILRQANQLDLAVNIGIPATRENAGQLEALLDIFSAYRVNHLYIFIPHGEGRGASLENIRLTSREFEQLSDRVRGYMNTAKFKPEKQWLAQAQLETPEKRMLGISLTPENMDFFENMSFADTIRYLEDMDDAYYRQVPTLEELARQYGDPEGEKFYSQRDLYLIYQRRYIREQGLSLHDVNDERQCFTRRF